MGRSNEKLNALIDYLIDYQDEYGVSPTYNEIAAAIGVKSKESVFRYLKRLEEEGQIKRNGMSSRNIELINPLRRGDFVCALELGSIKCGLPNAEECEYGDKVALPSNYFGDGELFILTACGDSMIDAGIEDGDKLVIRRQEYARNGQIAAVLVDGRENTLKRYYDEGDKYRLVAENESYEDIITKECKVQGVLVSCIKFYR